MSKKIVILSSTPRRGGNSELLCEQISAGAKDAGHQVNKIFIRDYKINYCTGCGVCFNGGKSCPQQDDMAEILDRMVAADVIVMATPVYFYTMSGQMKTLIDRTCARYREIRKKEFYFVVAAADSNLKAMERTIESFRGFTSCLDEAVEKGVLYGTGAWAKGEIKKSDTYNRAYEMGRMI